VSGPEAFLLSSPIVTTLLEQLPGLDLCRQSQRKNITNLNPKERKRIPGPRRRKDRSSSHRSVPSDGDDAELTNTEAESESTIDDELHQMSDSGVLGVCVVVSKQGNSQRS
jgi:hypothetical protein